MHRRFAALLCVPPTLPRGASFVTHSSSVNRIKANLGPRAHSFDFTRGSYADPTSPCTHHLINAAKQTNDDELRVMELLKPFLVEGKPAPPDDVLRVSAYKLMACRDVLNACRRSKNLKTLLLNLNGHLEEYAACFDFTRGGSSHNLTSDPCEHLDVLIERIVTGSSGNELITYLLRREGVSHLVSTSKQHSMRIVSTKATCAALKNRMASMPVLDLTPQLTRISNAILERFGAINSAAKQIIFVSGDSGDSGKKTLAALNALSCEHPPPIYLHDKEKVFGSVFCHVKHTRTLRDALVARCIARAVFARIAKLPDDPKPDIPAAFLESRATGDGRLLCDAVVAEAAAEFNVFRLLEDCHEADVRITVVLDELSSALEETQGICSIGAELETALAWHFKLRGKNSRVRLILVGTGFEDWRSNLGSSIDTYRVISMEPALVPEAAVASHHKKRK